MSLALRALDDGFKAGAMAPLSASLAAEFIVGRPGLVGAVAVFAHCDALEGCDTGRLARRELRGDEAGGRSPPVLLRGRMGVPKVADHVEFSGEARVALHTGEVGSGSGDAIGVFKLEVAPLEPVAQVEVPVRDAQAAEVSEASHE